jgi:hypothetical protein
LALYLKMLNVLITSKMDLIKIKLVTVVDLFRQSMTKFFSANNSQNAQQKPTTTKTNNTPKINKPRTQKNKHQQTTGKQHFDVSFYACKLRCS